ncbi:MAG: hypothetical protein LC643_03195 [Bacteroidales bacterium]|nr:hypothetical protein [Bacteroidales bacterium]
MIHANILCGDQVEVDETSSLNNVMLGDGVKVGRRTTIFGSPHRVLKVGAGTRIGQHTILNGTASVSMLRKFPIKEAPISIGNDCLIGHGTMVIAGVSIGDGVFVHPKSFVNSDIPPFSIAGGCPAKVIGKVSDTQSEIK